VFCSDPESGLKAIIAIHNLNRGPALGGCRRWSYASEDEALTDVLRLSRGMTYKAALAELPFGGGKSVILAEGNQDTGALYAAMGRFVETLGGRYTAAEDVGTSVEDVEIIGRHTSHIAGVPAGGAGDPSPATAYGTLHGIKAAVRHKLGQDDLKDLRVAVQGLGHVGYNLCRYLAAEGARLLVSDIDLESVERAKREFDAKAVAVDEIARTEADVFAPCALGAVIDDASIETLKARIVAGSANNQLAEPRHGEILRERGVLYAPDYVINGGGLINISHETRPGGKTYDKAKAFAHVARIGDTLTQIFELAEREGIATSLAADRIAESRFKGAKAKADAA
ncbi:MAG: amino acid dehydrogenase, partial [Rhodovibrionaceae bacterium]